MTRPQKKALFQPSKLSVGMAFFTLALGVWLYFPSVQYDFVYDDDAVLKNNRYVQKGIQGLYDIWTTSYFKGFDEKINARAFRPVPLSMFALEYSVFGLNPKIHHGVNVLLYGLTGLMLFLLLRRLFKHHLPYLAFFITLLFLVHPVHVEVVANIKSRDELVAFLAFITASFFLLKSVDSKNPRWLGLSGLFFTMALFSKESALTTVACIPMMLWFFRDLTWKGILRFSWMFIALAAGFLVVRSAVVGGLNEGVTLTPLDNSLLAAASASERVSSNIYVLGLYFFKNIYPHPLLSDYSLGTIPLVGWSDYRVWLSLLGYVVLAGLAIWGLHKKAQWAYGIWHFFITVSIFSSVIVLNVSAYNDRFNYNPSLGICFLLGFAAWWKIRNANLPPLSLLKKFPLLAGLACVVVLAGIWKVRQHLPVWQSRYALFQHDIQIAPNNARMLKNQGGSLVRLALAEKDKEKQLELAREALGYLERGLAIYDRMATGQVHAGLMYGVLGDYLQAEQRFKKALEMNAGDYYATTNLANIYYRTARFEEALRLMESLSPNLLNGNDHKLMSLLYIKMGDIPQANKHQELSLKK